MAGLCFVNLFLSQKAMILELSIFVLRIWMGVISRMIQFCIEEYHMWFVVESETAWEYEGSSSSSFLRISWAIS